MNQPQPIGIEELREQSICKLAGLILPSLAGAALQRGTNDMVQRAIDIAQRFQQVAEERCKKAALRDQLAGNT